MGRRKEVEDETERMRDVLVLDFSRGYFLEQKVGFEVLGEGKG